MSTLLVDVFFLAKSEQKKLDTFMIENRNVKKITITTKIMTKRPYTNVTFSGVYAVHFGGICLFRKPKLPAIFGFNCDEKQDFFGEISPRSFVKIRLFYFRFQMD